MRQIIFVTFFILANIAFNFNSFAQPCPLLTATGFNDVCIGGTLGINVTGAGSGSESWSSTNSSILTVASSGTGTGAATITGVALGTANVRYFIGGVFQCAKTITVRALPTPGTISTAGSFLLCAGDNTTATSSGDPGGVWTSSNTGQATVGSSDGVVIGVAAGAPYITYTVTNLYGCIAYATKQVTVNNLPSVSISGSSYVCHSGAVTLNPTPGSGGVWTSTSPGSATVGSSTGVVTGVVPGSTIIDYFYTDANGCSAAAAPHAMTVDPTPVAGTITGTFTVCRGLTTALGLSGSDPGGTWSSASNPTANVGTTGIVTGNSVGVVDISYTVTNSCGPVSAVASVTVNPLPNPGFVPNNSICLGGSSWNATTDGDAGGAWTSDNTGIATVGSSSGTVSSVSAGSTLITYTVTSAAGCIAYTTCTVSVDVPVTLNPISGASTLCVGATTPYTNSHTPGAWTSDDIGIATVNSSTGVVTGVSAGVTTITFLTANSCGTYYVTKAVTVNPLPDAGDITGITPLCHSGGTDGYTTDGDGGGLWTSSNGSIATVGTGTGIVNAVSAGVCTITYTVTNGFSCVAYSAKTVTIDPTPTPGTITGTFSGICTTTLSITGGDAGGVWTSSNTAIATVGSSSGFVYGISAGSCNITYTVSNACPPQYTYQTVTVNAMPNPGTITGTLNVCVGSTRALGSTGDGGGVWTSAATSKATINSTSGVVTGVAAGTATISYTVTNGCGTLSSTAIITVNALPNAGSVLGVSTVCTGGTESYTSTGAGGGTWSTSDPTKGTIDASGVVTGIAGGVIDVTYAVSNAAGCTSFSILVVTVNVTNAGTITGTFNVCPAGTTTLSNSTGDPGEWSSSNTSIATVGTYDGVVTGIATGTTTITYTTLDGYCPAYTTHTVYVFPLPNVGTITGTMNACPGGTRTLTNPTGDPGSWSRGSGTVTIGSASGIVTAVTSGTSGITYTATTGAGCTAYTTRVFTVDPLPNPGTITGTFTACPTATAALSSTGDPGGTWTSSHPTLATVGSASGIVTGVLGGYPTITYTAINGYGCTDYATKLFTVTPTPNAGTISGGTQVCVGSTITLSSSGDAGGAWSSSNVAVGTIGSASGVTGGISAAPVTLTYTATNVCGSAYTTKAVTVVPTPTITAGHDMCEENGYSINRTIWLTGSTTVEFGTFTNSAPSVAALTQHDEDEAWLDAGVSTGVTTVTYTIPGCSTVATHTVTVHPNPAVGTISPSSATIYASGTLTFSLSTGGTYSGLGWWTSALTPYADFPGTVWGRLEAIAFGSAAGDGPIYFYYTETTYGCTGWTVEPVVYYRP